MNANAKFLNEAKELEGRWAKSGLLEGIDKKYERGQTAVLLECQRLFNETGTWDCCDECKEREKEETVRKTIAKTTSKKQHWWLQSLKRRLGVK